MPKVKGSVTFGEAIETAICKDLERVQKDPTVPPRV
jgi:hypothetical protein